MQTASSSSRIQLKIVMFLQNDNILMQSHKPSGGMPRGCSTSGRSTPAPASSSWRPAPVSTGATVRAGPAISWWHSVTGRHSVLHTSCHLGVVHCVVGVVHCRVSTLAAWRHTRGHATWTTTRWRPVIML